MQSYATIVYRYSYTYMNNSMYLHYSTSTCVPTEVHGEINNFPVCFVCLYIYFSCTLHQICVADDRQLAVQAYPCQTLDSQPRDVQNQQPSLPRDVQS